MYLPCRKPPMDLRCRGERGFDIAVNAYGDSVTDGPALLREKFFAKRRGATHALIEHGIASGQLRPDLDPELVIDLLFGPIVFRLFNGIEPLNAGTATALAEMALRAIVPEDRVGR